VAGCVGYEVGCVGSSVVFVLELCGEQPRAEPALGVGCALGWRWGAVEWGLHYLKEIIFFLGGGWEALVGIGNFFERGALLGHGRLP